MIRVKNKILEQLAESERADFYEMLEDDTQLALGRKDTPARYNVIPCGEQVIIINPKDRQFPYCEGRVLSLYDILPELRNYAKFLAKKPEDEALKLLNQFSQQYDPKEVYDYLMTGLQEKTLWNLYEKHILEKYRDKDIDRTIEITETFLKGEWKGYVCMITGSNASHFKALQYWLERDLKKAKRFFAKRLRGINRNLFDRLEPQNEAEAE